MQVLERECNNYRRNRGRDELGVSTCGIPRQKKIGKCEAREYNKRRIWVVNGSMTSEKTNDVGGRFSGREVRTTSDICRASSVQPVHGSRGIWDARRGARERTRKRRRKRTTNPGGGK